MALKASLQKHVLDFRFDAGTSRGVLKQKNTWIIKAWDDTNEQVFGLGEASPLVKLSIDDVEDFEEQLSSICGKLSGKEPPVDEETMYSLLESIVPNHLPSVYFGFEVALLDLLHGGKRIIYNNEFSRGEACIPINGLVWMGYLEDMLLQVTDKVNEGFECIKVKVGSLDFEKECDLIQYIRNKYYNRDITLRLDANGAFSPQEALGKLQTLEKFNIHSIEQPIKAGQIDEMNQLCQSSPIPIALDEELIGIYGSAKKKALLEQIKPKYIILKPTLVGGLRSSHEWIEIAESLDIGWWMTSALESNIGLNAISQFTAQYDTAMPHGLGTGKLYHNNIDSPLTIERGHVYYKSPFTWDLSLLTQISS